MDIVTFNTMIEKAQNYVSKECAKVGAVIVNTEITCDLGDLVLIFYLKDENGKNVIPIETENLMYIKPNTRKFKLYYNSRRKVEFSNLIGK